jgi:transcriptional regulator with XRE-family HTH domain
MIREIVAREAKARKMYLPPNAPPRPVDISTSLQFTEAGLAMLAAHVRTGSLAAAARRRARSLLAEPIQRLLRWRRVHEVAAEAGMKSGYLRKILFGKVAPTVPTLRRVAAALRCTPAELLRHLEQLPR